MVLKKRCKYYDTSFEFNKAMPFQDNISILHTNICSSKHKVNDFMYYVNNLNSKFCFIGISETWATKYNDHLLNISNYNHEQCIRSNKKGVVVQVYIYIMIYRIKQDLIYLYPNNNMNQYSLRLNHQPSAQAEIQLLETFTKPFFKN